MRWEGGRGREGGFMAGSEDVVVGMRWVVVDVDIHMEGALRHWPASKSRCGAEIDAVRGLLDGWSDFNVQLLKAKTEIRGEGIHSLG